jgi:prevent-host-death family protein
MKREILMQQIGLFEAKNKLSALVARAEKGEEIVITKHGQAVARIVPVQAVFDREKAQEAAKGIRTLAKQMKLGPFDWKEWKQYRDEGRS